MVKDEKLLKKLTPEQVNVCHLGGTEYPFSGKYDKFFEKGTYKCVVCGTPLFSSETKFDAGTGWPSFSDLINNENIITNSDRSFGMARTEIKCKKCGSHLGHVFDYEESPTKLEYCVNSASLDFISDKS